MRGHFLRAATPKGIITSGLVLHLDAGQPASYPGSGATWTDLSSTGNNATLINGPTYSGSNGGRIALDGVNDYVSASQSSSLQFGTGDFTVSSWNYFSAAPVNMCLYDNLILGGNGVRVTSFVWITNGDRKLAIFASNSFKAVGATALSAATWYNFVLRRTSGYWTFAINTVLDGPSVLYSTGIGGSESGACIIGRVSNVASYFINGVSRSSASTTDL